MVAPPPLTTSLAALAALSGTFLGACWRECAGSSTPQRPPELLAAPPPLDGLTAEVSPRARRPGSAARRRRSPDADSRRKRLTGRKSPSRTATKSSAAPADPSSASAASRVAALLCLIVGILLLCVWRRSAVAEAPELDDLAPGFGDDGLESPVKPGGRRRLLSRLCRDLGSRNLLLARRGRPALSL